MNQDDMDMKELNKMKVTKAKAVAATAQQTNMESKDRKIGEKPKNVDDTSAQVPLSSDEGNRETDLHILANVNKQVDDQNSEENKAGHAGNQLVSAPVGSKGDVSEIADGAVLQKSSAAPPENPPIVTNEKKQEDGDTQSGDNSDKNNAVQQLAGEAQSSSTLASTQGNGTDFSNGAGQKVPQSNENRPVVTDGDKTVDDNNEDPPSSTATHLCFCIKDYKYDPLIYSIRLINLSDLFAKEVHEDPTCIFTEDLITSTEDFSEESGYGIVASSDGCLYVYTGIEKRIKKFLFRDLREMRDTRPYCEFDLMDRPKKTPIVAKIKECIYVLSHPYRHGSGAEDLHAFAVYDISHSTWKPLPPPPCMSETDAFYMLPITAYLVFDKYLCVSTRFMSFAFNTETNEWEGCLLFCEGQTDASVRPPYGPPPYGPPFPFAMGAYMYDCFLLCTQDKSPYDVLAYKIVNGRVVEGEPAVILSGSNKRNDFGYHNMLVDLGGGEGCIVSRDADLLYFTKFKVAKICNGENLMWKESDVKESLIHWPQDPWLMIALYQTVSF